MTGFAKSGICPDKSPDIDGDCGVTEEQFPRMKICCGRSSTSVRAEFQKTCPNCDIWTSLPDSETLKVATFFECGRYGYSKRLQDTNIK